MNCSIRFRRRLAAAILVLAAWPLAPAVQAAPAPPDVPSAIAVPDGHKVFLVAHAVGVQIYRCTATASGFAWSFVAPGADLYGENGKHAGSHFAGPTWRARDGSTVVARRVAGVTVDPAAIDWLLLAATSTASGGDGDRLAGTTYIQRTATSGGLAPAATDCNAATAGAQAEVPYTADYHFWKARRDS
jgi:FtsP/CotA-like multicopper oxidase with cupredoxin domain